MNEEFHPQHDISLSSIQNPTPGADYSMAMDISLDTKDIGHPTSNKNGQTRSVPMLSDLKPPFLDIISPGDSNVPTQGDVFSPKQEAFQLNQNVLPNRINSQTPNQVPPRGFGQGEHEIFSFRREGQQGPHSHQNPQSHTISPNPEENINDEDLFNDAADDKTCLLKIKTVYIFVFLNLLCLGLVVFNFYVAYSMEKITFPQIEKLDRQFQQKIVLDIELISPNEKCNEIYSPTSMGYWPGYKTLCACPTKSYPGVCQLTDRLLCDIVTDLSPVPITTWDQKKICIRKSEKTILQYYETSDFMESYNGNFMCPNGLKKCIVSASRNFICVGRFEMCPITQIEVDNDKNNEKNKFKANIPFKNKVLVFDNQGAAIAVFTDFIVAHSYCNPDLGHIEDLNNSDYCYNNISKNYLDSMSEGAVLYDNVDYNMRETYGKVNRTNILMDLFVVPLNELNDCIFNNTFNPVILHSELVNWKKTQTILFMTPFCVSTLLVINMIRMFVVHYLNKKTEENPSIKRKKEVYNLFGNLFAGSSPAIITQVCITMYYLIWGYLVLNPDKLIADRWVSMDCLTIEVKREVQYMIDQFSQIEMYNVVTIIPVLLCVVIESLLAPAKLISAPYQQLNEVVE